MGSFLSLKESKPVFFIKRANATRIAVGTDGEIEQEAARDLRLWLQPLMLTPLPPPTPQFGLNADPLASEGEFTSVTSTSKIFSRLVFNCYEPIKIESSLVHLPEAESYHYQHSHLDETWADRLKD